MPEDTLCNDESEDGKTVYTIKIAFGVTFGGHAMQLFKQRIDHAKRNIDLFYFIINCG